MYCDSHGRQVAAVHQQIRRGLPERTEIASILGLAQSNPTLHDTSYIHIMSQFVFASFLADLEGSVQSQELPHLRSQKEEKQEQHAPGGWPRCAGCRGATP